MTTTIIKADKFFACLLALTRCSFHIATNRLYISPDHLSLTISPLLLEDNGLIQVTVFNEVGTSYSDYYLLIGS